MRNRYLDLFSLTVLAYLGLLLLPLDTAWKAPFTLPLVLFLPGYAINSAIFGHKKNDRAERLLFGIGVSISLTALGGLLLNLTRWGLQPASLGLLLGGITLVATLIAWAKRTHYFIPEAGGERHAQDILAPFFIGLAAILILLAVGVSRLPTPPQGFQGYTLLSITPGEKSGTETFEVVITSREFVPQLYRLQILAGKDLLATLSPIQLMPGETRQVPASMPAGLMPRTAIEARLYRLDLPGEPYRHVILWPEK